MSSATSIDPSTGPAGRSAAQPAASDDHALSPWQFFLLAGMLCATGVVIVATGQSPASIILLSLTVIAASFVALGAYRALAPLVAPESEAAPSATAGRLRAGLEREKTLVLRSIKELEFDFAMGKIAQADFAELSAKLRTRAMGLMRQLEAGGGYREAIEQELGRRLAAEPRPVRPPATCACGVVNDPDARFCKQCGSKLSAA